MSRMKIPKIACAVTRAEKNGITKRNDENSNE